MFKRVLFCIPPFPNRYGLPTHPHTGIGYLCESLNANNIKTAVVDFRLGAGYKRLQKEIEDFKPDLFGVTMMTYYHNLAYELVAHLEQFNIPIAIGGPHVSTLKEEAVVGCGADFGFIMEAERSLVDFCDGQPLESIPGLIYRKNGRVLENSPRLIMDLDNVPFPRYRDMDLDVYARKRIAIITSRGCPCQCTFCPVSTVMGRRYRLRSAEDVFAEISFWYQRGFRDFDFQDDNFTLDKTRVYCLFDMLKDERLNDLFMQCGNGIRADLADKGLFERMKEAGFKAIAIGVESANPAVLKRVKKGETFDQIDNAVKTAIDTGLEVSLFFIVGLPGETAESFKESVEFALKYPVTTATFYNLIPFPGTELYDWVENNNYFILEPKKYLNTIAHLELVPVFQTPYFSAEERTKALKLGLKVNDRIKRKDLERKLGNSLFSAALAWLVYESFFNKVLFGLIQVKLVKRFMNFVLLKLRLRVNL